QHLRNAMVNFKNRLVYDSVTGQIRDDRRFMTMYDDFWFARRGEGRGTEVTTLPAGENLGKMEDVYYFEKKLYRALNVPISRIDPENAVFNVGHASEISRDEFKFARFIDRVRIRFSALFLR